MNTNKESFVSFVWQYQKFINSPLYCTNGDKLEVVSPGTLNRFDGPDFFNAKLRIGGTLWAGNVELHVQSSDWVKHKHSADPAFDSVILHVVLEHDYRVKTRSGFDLATFCIKQYLIPSIVSRYHQFALKQNWIPCQNLLPNVDNFHWHQCVQRMGIHRLERRYKGLEKQLFSLKNNWNELAFQVIAESFGGSANKDAFKDLVRIIPFFNLMRLQSLEMIEALVFGLSGLLDRLLEKSVGADRMYFKRLRRNFISMQLRYGQLVTMKCQDWKFAKQRPANSPIMRLAQFSAFICHNKLFFGKMISYVSPHEFKHLFQIELAQHWYSVCGISKKKQIASQAFSKEFIDLIFINSIVPILFFYGKVKGKEIFSQRALNLLEELKAESNSIIKKWTNLGFPIENAFYSQAAIELKNEFCSKKRCAQCVIGHQILVGE